MKIILYDGTVIKCWKIEPTMKGIYLIIDEDYTVALIDILCIIGDKEK